MRIRVGIWNERAQKGTVLLLPGRTEYVEKYAHTAQDLARGGYATLTVDWRGQGLSDRLLGDPMIGHVGAFADYQRDVRAMMAAARQMDLPRPWFLLAHSMGGCIGLRAMHEGLPVAGAIFTGPMWGIQMGAAARPAAWAVSWASRYLGMSEKLSPGTRAEAYVSIAPFEDNTLTTDPGMYGLMQDQLNLRPELSLGGPSLNWLHEALAESLALSRLPAPALPCLTYLGGHERVVDPQRVRALMLAWPGGKLEEVPGAEHEILMETPSIRQRTAAEILDFFDATGAGKAPFGAPVSATDQILRSA
ncbi:MAG: alpha/beta hydrolase [Thalassovita sp.]|nr:alpha/beta hydrolase [Thalassovita sp.]